jgi:hypothetical protein
MMSEKESSIRAVNARIAEGYDTLVFDPTA